MPEHRLLLGRYNDIREDRQTCRMRKGGNDRLHRDVVLPRAHGEYDSKEEGTDKRTEKEPCSVDSFHCNAPLPSSAVPRITESS